MKKVILLCSVVFLSGCAEMSSYLAGQTNQESVMTQRRNLNGMTYQQVKNMFGVPGKVSTFQRQTGVMETWVYEHTSMNMFYSGAKTMTVTFDNGVVTSVDYY